MIVLSRNYYKPTFDITIFTELLLDECEIDYESSDRKHLKSIVLDCVNSDAPVTNDDYFVQVNLKDTYAYAPKKFAL